MLDFIHYNGKYIFSDSIILLNWWLMSPFAPVLCLVNYFHRRYNFNFLVKHLGIIIYIFGFILSTELFAWIKYNGTMPYYIGSYQLDNDILYLLIDKRVMLIIRYIVYILTIYAIIVDHKINNMYNFNPVDLNNVDLNTVDSTILNSDPIDSTTLIADPTTLIADPNLLRRRYIYAVKLNYPILLMIMFVIVITNSLIFNYKTFISFNDEDLGLDLRYSMGFLIYSQPIVLTIVLLALKKNYTKIKESIETITEVKHSIISTTCHGTVLTNYDLVNDFANIVICSAFISIVYLDIIVLILTLCLSFDYTREKFLVWCAVYLASRLIVVSLNMCIGKILIWLCTRYPNLTYALDYYFLIGNSVTLIMRLQQSFERLILIIIYAPVTNLNFTDVYLDKTINNHYLSMILGLAKK